VLWTDLLHDACFGNYFCYAPQFLPFNDRLLRPRSRHYGLAPIECTTRTFNDAALADQMGSAIAEDWLQQYVTLDHLTLVDCQTVIWCRDELAARACGVGGKHFAINQ